MLDDILLSTVLILICDKNNQFHTCRALLDSASHFNFLTTEFANKLGLPIEHFDVSVLSLNERETKLNHILSTTIKSQFSDFNNILKFVIIPTITTTLPSNIINISRWKLPHTIKLADPNFHIPNKIDALLGAELFLKILKNGRFQIGNNLPYIQNSEFGWFLMGKYETQQFYSFC